MRLVDEHLAKETEKEQDNAKVTSDDKEDMTFRQKMEHFWEYEKWKVIIPLVLLLVINSFVQTYKSEHQTLTLDIALVNAVMESANDVEFHNDFIKQYNIDVEQAPVKIETGMVHPEVMDEKAAMDEVAVASIQKYQAMLISGRVDITISNSWAIEEYAQSDSYENLKEFLSEDLYETVEDRLFYCVNGQGEKIPVGIMVDEIDSINQFYSDTPIVTVSKHSERKEESILFIQWLAKSMKEF